MSDFVMGNAESSALRRDLIPALVQRELIDKAVLGGAVMDVSAFAEPGATSIKFPRAGSFSVQKKKEDEEAQAQTVTYATDQLNLDQEAVVQWIIPKRSKTQSAIALEQDCIARAVRAHAKTVDRDLLDAMEAGIQSGENVSISTNLALGNISEAKRKLKNKNWEDDLWMVCSPEIEEDLLNIDNFNTANQYGSREGLLNGVIGRVYGVNVLVSNQLEDATGTARSAFMFHRESIALGFQSAPDLDSQKDLKNLGMRWSLDQLYGYKVLQASADVGIIKLTT